MPYKLNIGDAIPDFVGVDQDEQQVNSLDFRKAPLVLYFYPKDNTPGCTAEACSFRDHLSQMEKVKGRVIGISPDEVNSHKAFIQQHLLNFTLISDPQKEICKKFDVLRQEGGNSKVERTTFVIDPDGIIRWIERPVNVEGHVERILAFLAQ